MIFDLNYLTLAIFAPLLVLIGIVSFVIPAPKVRPAALRLTIFSMFAELSAPALCSSAIRNLNIGFGLLGLY